MRFASCSSLCIAYIYSCGIDSYLVDGSHFSLRENIVRMRVSMCTLLQSENILRAGYRRSNLKNLL